jgi:hypothetical protein
MSWNDCQLKAGSDISRILVRNRNRATPSVPLCVALCVHAFDTLKLLQTHQQQSASTTTSGTVTAESLILTNCRRAFIFAKRYVCEAVVTEAVDSGLSC